MVSFTGVMEDTIRDSGMTANKVESESIEYFLKFIYHFLFFFFLPNLCISFFKTKGSDGVERKGEWDLGKKIRWL